VESIGRRTEVAHRISEDLKQWIISKLKAGFIAQQVFKEHKRVWYEGWTKGRKYSKDNSLLLKDVRYYEH
jgi:hypothetical protein